MVPENPFYGATLRLRKASQVSSKGDLADLRSGRKRAVFGSVARYDFCFNEKNRASQRRSTPTISPIPLKPGYYAVGVSIRDEQAAATSYLRREITVGAGDAAARR